MGALGLVVAIGLMGAVVSSMGAIVGGLLGAVVGGLMRAVIGSMRAIVGLMGILNCWSWPDSLMMDDESEWWTGVFWRLWSGVPKMGSKAWHDAKGHPWKPDGQ